MGIKLGQVDYLNCLPVYHALEEGLLKFDGNLVKGPPAVLNRMFLEGGLDATPISSIEYARNSDNCLIVPNMSISADGKVSSVLLFSRCPVTELEGKTVAVTTSSATSVVLLRILMEHYFHVDAELIPYEPDLKKMMKMAEGALLIGDDAMISDYRLAEEGTDLVVTDLGEAWKQFTGEMMIYAVWVVRKEFALEQPEELEKLTRLLVTSKDIGMLNIGTLIKKAHKNTGLPYKILEDYFKTILYEFTGEYQKSLSVFFDYAYKSGIIEERARINVWGEQDG